MIAIGTENLNKLVYDGVFDLKKFIEGHKNIGYIETSLVYDNDMFLRGKFPRDVVVLSRFPGVKDLEVNIEFHRHYLGYPENQVILLPGGTSWGDIKDFLGKYRFGVYDPEIEELEEYFETLRRYPEYISLRINPLLYPKELLDYCKEKEIKTISHDIFGGKIWAGYLRNMFPDGFLFDFSRVNTDIQVLPSDDLLFLGDMVGRDKVVPKPGGALYKYSKNINKLPALELPPRKIHGQTSIKIDEVGEFKLPCGDKTDIYSLKKEESKLPGKVVWEDTEDSLHRYHAEVWIDENYSPEWWKKVYTKVTKDFYTIKLIPSKWYLGWITKEHYFWLISGKLIKMPLTGHEKLNNEY